MGMLAGKAGIVTGAAQGFGRATAVRLCEEGAAVALVDVKAEALEAAASELAQTATTFGTSGLEAMAVTARGAVLLAEGNITEALPVLRDACRRWYELGSAYDAAGT